MSQFTLVRHSAYALGADASFEDAVNARELTAQEAYLVRGAGGLLFPTLAAAQQAANAANATNGVSGYFSNLRIAGAEIYLPYRKPPKAL